MYGWSRGGMMTYSALTRTNRIKAAIVGSGMADAFASIKERPDLEAVYSRLVPNYKENKEAALISRSAVQWADRINKNTPLLIMHGSSDWRVAPDQAFSMTRKLYGHKHPFRFVMFEGGDHSLMEHYEEVNRLTKNFLNHYVRDRKEWPSMLVHGD